MDPAQHDRFLEYLERFEYFGRGDTVRLGRDEFAVIDKEYQRLSRLERRDAEDEETYRAFRVALLKD